MPDDWRIGQSLFNFLEWLRTDKGYDPNQSFRMADPFSIDDDEMDKLLNEYQVYLDAQKRG